METNVKKRDRGKNFTELEKENLLVIAKKYVHIIENKKTDAITSKEKMQVWDVIASQFNSTATTGPRNGQQLKLLYEALKKKAKKHKADDKMEVYKTGGGCALSSLDHTDEKILAMVGEQLEPLHNPYDSNKIVTNQATEGYSFLIGEVIECSDTAAQSNCTVVVDNGPTANDTGNVTVPTVNAASTTVKRSIFTKIQQNKKTNNEKLFIMKKERHKAKMDILQIIKEKETIELEIKKIELDKLKKEMLHN